MLYAIKDNMVIVNTILLSNTFHYPGFSDHSKRKKKSYNSISLLISTTELIRLNLITGRQDFFNYLFIMPSQASPLSTTFSHYIKKKKKKKKLRERERERKRERERIFTQNIYIINTIFLYIDQILLNNSSNSSQKCPLKFYFLHHPI